MSTSPSDQPLSSGLSGSGAKALFQHEVRLEGRVVATLRGRATATGVTVDTDVFPITQAAGGEGIRRPFDFPGVSQARRFVDETLVAFEYLNCTVS